MRSCMRPLPFHAGSEIGPEDITLASEMTKHNGRNVYGENEHKSALHIVLLSPQSLHSPLHVAPLCRETTFPPENCYGAILRYTLGSYQLRALMLE
jgi:hypothetical protein